MGETLTPKTPILKHFTLKSAILTLEFANYCNFPPKNANLDNFFYQKSAILENFPLLDAVIV